MYRSYVTKPLWYGTECWALRKENERKLQTIEMRVLRMMCKKTRRDSISVQTILDSCYNMRGENRRVHERAEIRMV